VQWPSDVLHTNTLRWRDIVISVTHEPPRLHLINPMRTCVVYLVCVRFFCEKFLSPSGGGEKDSFAKPIPRFAAVATGLLGPMSMKRIEF
jgi:hypothetical protein